VRPIPTNDFLPFATGAGANVENQASYASDPSTSAGFSAGIAQSQKLNKVWRQASFISAAMAQIVVNELGVDVLDDGDLAGFTGKLHDALTALQPREVLYANTTFYVNGTTGSDSFDGESPTSAWLTTQHAADVLCFNTDVNNKNVVVQLADGQYPGFLLSSTILGLASPAQLIFQGNMTSPGNVVITPSLANGTCALARNNTQMQIQGVRFSGITPPFTGAPCHAVATINLGRIRIANCDFATCLGYHMTSSLHSQLRLAGSYSISGGAARHLDTNANATFVGAVTSADNPTNSPLFNVTINNAPHFSDVFCNAHQQSMCQFWDGLGPLMTWTGAATGVRFRVQTSSLLHTNGQALTWLPGDTAGIVDATTGGVYS
jgi:hypothetical protein